MSLMLELVRSIVQLDNSLEEFQHDSHEVQTPMRVLNNPYHSFHYRPSYVLHHLRNITLANQIPMI